MKPEEFTSLLDNTSKEDVENLVKYLKNQKAEAHAIAHGQTNKEIVQAYLEKMAELDPTIAAVYPNNDAGKSIDDCLAYIDNLAEKLVPEKHGTQCVKLPSFTVFEWAERYFLDASIPKFKKDPIPAPKTFQSKKRTITDLQKEKEQWEAQNAKASQNWEIENNKKIDQFEKEHAQDLFPPENPHIKNVNPFLGKTFPQQEELDKLLNTQEPAQDEASEDAIGEIQEVTENEEEETESQQ